MNGFTYRCLVGGVCPVISNVVTLTINPVFDTIVTTIGSVKACIGDQIIIPVHVTNFIDVGSVSHRITFNDTVFTYIGYQKGI